MRIVDKAPRPPGMCLVSRDTEGPFFDTGLYARHRDPYMYIGTRWVEEAAQELGMVPKKKVEELEAQLAALGEQFDALSAVVQKQHDLEDALTTVLNAPVFVGQSSNGDSDGE